MISEKDTATTSTKMRFVRETKINAETLILLKIKLCKQFLNILLQNKEYTGKVIVKKENFIKQKRKAGIDYIILKYRILNKHIEKTKFIYIEKTLYTHLFSDMVILHLLTETLNSQEQSIDEYNAVINKLYNLVKEDIVPILEKTNKAKLKNITPFFTKITYLQNETTKTKNSFLI